MRRRTHSLRALAAILTLALGTTPLFAGVWTEVGDAGEVPTTAQETLGVGLLGSIFGTLVPGTPDDVDMYGIFISDPDAFSAIANPDGTHLLMSGGFELNDATLFVFDSAGYQVASDDDDGELLLPAIYPGELAGNSPGYYFISFSLFETLPTADPITGWSRNPATLQTGPYQIDLTGALPSNIPEPATLLLLASGVLGLVPCVRRRAKRLDRE